MAEPGSHPDNLSRPRFRGCITAAVALTAVAYALVVGSLFLEDYSPTIELLGSFRPQLFALGGLICIVFALLRRWGWLLVAMMAAVLVAIPVAPLWVPDFNPTVTQRATPHLKLLQYNLEVSNANGDDQAPLVNLVREFEPDVITLQELTPRSLALISRALPEYQYGVAVPRDDPFGIGIFSKLPSEGFTTEIEPTTHPVVGARFGISPATLTIYTCHPPAPLSPADLAGRDRVLGEVAALARGTTGPVIVAGDFNSAPWSRGFVEFLRQSRLHDSARGFGLQFTFPTGGLVGRVPIDTAASTDEVLAVGRQVGPAIGSDHFPVMISFVLLPELRP